MARVIPANWADAEKRLYVSIAKRRKEEAASMYAAVCIGCQLFLTLTHNEETAVAHQEQANVEVADASGADALDLPADCA